MADSARAVADDRKREPVEFALPDLAASRLFHLGGGALGNRFSAFACDGIGALCSGDDRGSRLAEPQYLGGVA